MLVAAPLGVLAQSLVIGEVLIVVYAIFAFVRRVPSRTTFLLALMSLVLIVVLLTMKPESRLAQNFAVYTFLLLVIGTISLAIEVRSEY